MKDEELAKKVKELIAEAEEGSERRYTAIIIGGEENIEISLLDHIVERIELKVKIINKEACEFSKTKLTKIAKEISKKTGITGRELKQYLKNNYSDYGINTNETMAGFGGDEIGIYSGGPGYMLNIAKIAKIHYAPLKNEEI